MKKVSQIICYYNEEKYIKAAIESIINQPYTNIELICVNDGSTDRGPEIVDSIKDDRIVHLNFKDNHGRPWARNRGLEAATGEYIGFFDGDDISEVGRIETLVNYLDENEDYFVVSGDCTTMNEDGDYTGEIKGIYHTDEELKAALLFMNPISFPCAIFRRVCIDKGVRFDEKMLRSQDFLFWQDCISFGKYKMLGQSMFKYRQYAIRTGIEADKKLNEEFNLYIFKKAWSYRGFDLSDDDIYFIFYYLYSAKPINRVLTYRINATKLYRKICNQMEKLQLNEAEMIRKIYLNRVNDNVLKRFVKGVLKIE